VDSLTSTAWFASDYGAQQGTLAATRPESPSLEVSDEVALTPGARVLAGVLNGSSRLSKGGGAIRVEDVRADYEQQLEALQNSLAQRFASRNIDDSTPIRLQTASDGRVIVAGDHPQKEAIEKLFVDEPRLRDRFVRVDSQGSFLRSADEAIAFQRAYRKDPTAALREFAHLFDQNESPKFTLAVQDGAFNTLFF
jgi:hypothetical protein